MILLGTGLKTDIFQCCCHCWIFQICWYTECSTLTASLFRILNSLAEMPSPLLVFIVFIVMLPKAHLTSYSKKSDSRWVSTSSFLSRSLRSFLYSSSIYSCHLFLISFTSIRSILFLIFIMPILAQNVPLISRVILKRSLVYPSYFSPSISLHCLFKKVFLLSLLSSATLHSVGYIFPLLLWLSLLFFPQLFVKPPQKATLPAFISFSLGWFWSLPPVHVMNLCP